MEECIEQKKQIQKLAMQICQRTTCKPSAVAAVTDGLYDSQLANQLVNVVNSLVNMIG